MTTARATTTVWLVRHGETRSYEADSGLTPRGVDQAYRAGVELAAAVGDGPVRVVTARSARARETAEHLHRGLPGAVPEPADAAEFDNFAVTTPTGPRELTAAFPAFAAAREHHERAGTGPPPGWVVEIGRFWAEQQGGGDPIRFWLTVPLLAFEPPSLCVRRFWSGVRRLVRAHAGGHVVVATHSGPMRAFAASAAGRDPGEPHNAEAVVVRVAGEVAAVSYRGSTHEVRVPSRPGDVVDPVPGDEGRRRRGGAARGSNSSSDGSHLRGT